MADFWTEISRPERFTPGHIETLRKLLEGGVSMNPPTHIYAGERVGLEILDALIRLNASVQQLDESSGKLVTTTNKLTSQMLVLTYVGVFLAFIGAVLGAMQFFVAR